MPRPATLTALELTVYDALLDNALEQAGGDFGILETVNYRKLGLSGQQFGALVTTLQQKRKVTVYGAITVNGNTRDAARVTQFTIDEDA